MTKKTANDNKSFKKGDHVVYPAHGVGRVTGVEKDSVAGFDIEVYVVSFEQDKMTLRVPTTKAAAQGMRPLANDDVQKNGLKALKTNPKVKSTIWSRRAQEYEAKINSGDLISIAEVVRDLHRQEDQPEPSYSERQLYESALDRMVREVAVVEKVDRDKALEILTTTLTKKAA